MNDILFSNSFLFRTFMFESYHYTDNRQGAPTHYFAYMLSGNCKIVTESETVSINEGDIFYIPDKCSYRSYWYGTPEIKFISLGFVYFPNIENKKYAVQVIPFDEEAVNIMLRLGECGRVSAADIGDFYTLAGRLIPLMSHTHICRTREIVTRTQKYLMQHPTAKAAELAKNCAVSEAALYTAFKKASDVTPNQLRNKIVLEKAKELLITTDKSVETVSECLNFSSSSWFRKKFKEHFGITPKEMRKKHRI